MTDYTFTPEELELTIEALTKAASRHDSEARFYPARKRVHDAKAKAMRALASKLQKYSNAAAA